MVIVRGRRVEFRGKEYHRDAKKIQLQAGGSGIGETDMKHGKWPFWHSGPFRLPTLMKGNLALGLAGQLGCIHVDNARL
jgi:hypothetical protein